MEVERAELADQAGDIAAFRADPEDAGGCSGRGRRAGGRVAVRSVEVDDHRVGARAWSDDRLACTSLAHLCLSALHRLAVALDGDVGLAGRAVGVDGDRDRRLSERRGLADASGEPRTKLDVDRQARRAGGRRDRDQRLGGLQADAQAERSVGGGQRARQRLTGSLGALKHDLEAGGGRRNSAGEDDRLVVSDWLLWSGE